MTENQKKGSLQQRTSVFPFYPILFGLYPVLALIALNISQIDLSATYRVIIFSAALSISLFGLLRLVMRSWMRAAFLTLLLLLLFFAYGHFYVILKNPQNPLLPFVRHRILIFVWIALGALAVWVSTRKSINLPFTTSALNILSAVLLVYPIFQIAQYEIRNRTVRPAAVIAAVSSSHPTYPDIYYIILDAYMRSDNLQAVYGYDNSAFIAGLTKRGFYVASCSQSNYAVTELSLTSSLNLDYLDKLEVTNDNQAYPLLKTNVVRSFLKAQGYTDVAFETGYRWTQWEDADYYYKYRPNAYLVNSFESLFLQTTLMRMPLDGMQTNEAMTDGAIWHNRILFDLETLKNLPGSVKGPKFVFAHLVIPHPPFVFGPNGELENNDPTNLANLAGYRNSVAFINTQILQVVDKILANSKTPPIIIIQGDHGAPYYNMPAQRTTILNAYYLPGVKAALYPTITPVNTFRIVFNSYFGQNYPLLEDVGRYSPLHDQYDFTIIPDTCGK